MVLSAILIPIATIGGMALVFGGCLGYAAIKFAVPVDERVAAVLENLPGANCGGCGKAGCEAMAKAMVAGECLASGCPVCNAQQIASISKILGVEQVEVEKKVAYVRCQGGRDQAKQKFQYEGQMTCKDAQLVGGGPKMCTYGCLGYGTCEAACSFKAITMVNGLPMINRELCTGCGNCATQCPRHIIEIIPLSSNYHVNCISQDKGKAVKEACKVGCIGCGLCVRQCEQGAIQIQDNHALIKYELCISCGRCEEKCPTKAISHLLEVGNKQSLKKETPSA